jgi:predicted DNA-binding protein with PD1-like motif
MNAATSPEGARLQATESGGVWAVRLKPYEDLTTSLCAFGAEMGLRRISVLGCVGSLMHATLQGANGEVRYTEGPGVEIVTASGWLDVEQPATSALTLTVADRQGALHAGRPAPGGNPVCVTVELIIQEWK